MDQYQEDKLSGLDIAKTVAASAFLPQYAYMYDPTLWKMNGGVSLDPFTKNPLVRLGKHIINSRKPSGTGAPTATASTYYSQYNVRRRNVLPQAKSMDNSISARNDHFARTSALPSNRRSAAQRAFAKFGLQLDNNNILSLNKTPIHKQSWYIRSKLLENKLQYRIDNRSLLENSRVEKLNRIQSTINKNEILIKQRSSKSSRTFEKLKQSKIEQNIALKNQMSGIRAELEDIRGFSDKQLRYHKRGLATSRVAKYIGLSTARTLVKIGTTVAKGAAIYNIGSLMYEGINMVANPIGRAAVDSVNSAFNTFASYTKPELGGTLNMGFVSYGAATERQRAIQAISKSRINGRSMLGQEAAYMHN